MFGARVRRVAAVVLTVVILAATIVVAGCTAPAGTTTGAGAETKAPYKIGAVLSLTGSYAGLGAPEQNAIKMEVERINAAGGSTAACWRSSSRTTRPTRRRLERQLRA